MGLLFWKKKKRQAMPTPPPRAPRPEEADGTPKAEPPAVRGQRIRLMGDARLDQVTKHITEARAESTKAMGVANEALRLARENGDTIEALPPIPDIPKPVAEHYGEFGVVLTCASGWRFVLEAVTDTDADGNPVQVVELGLLPEA